METIFLKVIRTFQTSTLDRVRTIFKLNVFVKIESVASALNFFVCVFFCLYTVCSQFVYAIIFFVVSFAMRTSKQVGMLPNTLYINLELCLVSSQHTRPV